MSKITQNYIEARRDGIKWLNSNKRNYSTGVNILTRSGYKGFVAARLARQGEKPHTREKLEYEIRQMIKVWYHPDDPRFEDVDLADDAMPGNDGRAETVPEETAAAIVTIAEKELARETDEQPAYPPVIAKSSMISGIATMNVHGCTGYSPNRVRPIRRLYVHSVRILLPV